MGETLEEFLRLDPSYASSRDASGVKRGRPDEMHWATDDPLILNEGLIDTGSWGEVHRV